jgi:YbbR domain-containing protein
VNLRKLLFDNLGLKLVSLLLAYLLWFNVSSEPVVERALTVPVEFLNTPPNLEISNDYTKNLDVHVSTRRGALSGGSVNISVLIDLRDAHEGERIIPIGDADVRKPEGVTVLHVTPSRITLVLERTGHKLVRVEPQLTGLPAAGYQVTSVAATPGEIMVTGPESRVQKVVKAVTETIDISNAKASVDREVNVDVADAKLRIDRVSPVRVQVLIEEQRNTEKLEVPLVVAPGLQTNTKAVELFVSFPKTFARTLRPSMFSIRLDRPVNAKRGAEMELPPQVTMNERPQAVRVDKIVPEKIKVKVL